MRRLAAVLRARRKAAWLVAGLALPLLVLAAAVVLWFSRSRTETLPVIRAFDAHPGEYVAALSFSPDGRLLAVGGRRLALYDVATGRARSLADPDEAAGRRPAMLTLALAFSPDGCRLATGDHAGLVRLWDVASARLVATFEGHSPRRVLALAFSPLGDSLASAGDDRNIRVCAIPGLIERIALRWPATRDFPGLPRPSGYALGYRRDGRVLAAAEFRSTSILSLWDTESGEGRVVRDDFSSLWPYQFSPDAEALLAADSEAVGIWDTGTGRQRRRLTGPAAGSWGGSGSAWSPDGRYLAVPWTRRVGERIEQYPEFEQRALAWFGIGPGHRTDVVVHDAEDGAIRAVLGRQSLAAYSPDGRIIATCDARGVVRIWDASGLPRGSAPGA